MKTGNYTPEGLRKLTEKVQDAIAPGIGENDAYVFTVTRGTHGSPWMHGFHVGAEGLSVSVSGGGAVNAAPDTTYVSLVTKPIDREFRNVVEINVMWVALAGTEVFEDLYTLNGVGEDVVAGGRFYDNLHFGVDMYVPGGMGGTVADTLFLCLAWGYLYSLPPEDDGKTVAINVAALRELAPAGTEIPVAMSNVEGSTVRAGFEYLTQELRDRGVFCRNKTLNNSFGFKVSGF